ncbi:MAG: hypothetical protein ACK5T7_16810, partial [Gemmatimonas sp.]
MSEANVTNGSEAAEQGAPADQKQELNFLMPARREKLERLRAAGVEPFGYSYDRTHTASEAGAA